MRISRRAVGAAAGVTLALGATTALAAPAASAAPATASKASVAATHKLGTKSLVSVLAADKSGFDRNGKDFDVLTAAVVAVLKAKPKSAVGVLGNGKVALTAFIPNDDAFRYLVRDLTGKGPRSEADVFKAVASLGIPTVEKVLLYHVVPGKTITARMALKSNGAHLKTALGPTIKVRVTKHGLFLQDKDPNARNPKVVAVDINKGNRQIAHAIDRVLRPLDLPPVARHH
ncbi:MAG TPA: fasciclin domain-containing protein [Kineosporiaceae bacterium]|nr:fasciclin domain-containing protein [Kineosporiaceae bacterium]